MLVLAIWALLILAAVAVWSRIAYKDDDDDAQERYLREWRRNRKDGP
jgi:hypothetical protein